MKTNPVGWFEIYVQDMKRAKAFYGGSIARKTGGRISQSHPWPRSGIVELSPVSEGGYGAAGALAKMEGCASGGGGTLVYFACEDCAVEAARAAEHGGRIFKEKMSIGKYGFIALVFDTEENMIGLHSMRLMPPEHACRIMRSDFPFNTIGRCTSRADISGARRGVPSIGRFVSVPLPKSARQPA